ncbi:hypothetical protein [Comamonas testosteroni]|uniref:hypothetical protein n=1 Tax=Comamonas testosteroni TaxID=285 RepID=UPI0020D21319|nr:hypothetical protein [Comamonas testosteroni]
MKSSLQAMMSTSTRWASMGALAVLCTACAVPGEYDSGYGGGYGGSYGSTTVYSTQPAYPAYPAYPVYPGPGPQ